MKLLSRSFLLLLFSFICATAFAQKKGLSIAKPASWVLDKKVNYISTVNANEVQDGYFYLLSDNQRNVEEKISYAHFAMKIISDAGVQNASQVSIDYNPEYEQLQLHKVEIIRNGNHINKLELSKFKTLQRETDLERNIYDGTYTAVSILDDVRKGDVIEYAYSIKGKNPIYSQKFSTWFYTQYSIPLAELSQRIICNSSRKLSIKEFNNSLKPVIKQSGDKTIYEWHGTNIKPLISDDNLPQWYEAYSYTSMSEFASWKEVKDWGVNLFKRTEPLSPSLKDTINKIAKSGLSPEAKALAAVRFIQNQIRYMGIEIGVYSHLPNTPNRVFAQRFGDCKDKSQLLCVMLKELGIEAHPVLINTTAKDELQKMLPTANSFNHCTVQIKIEGKLYWIDPTIAYQCGDLRTNSYPDYRWGLVVTDGSEGLTKIEARDIGSITVKEEFDIIDFTSPSNFTVTTTYAGDEADLIRYQMANSSMKELEESYKNFYAKLYPKIRLRDSLKIEDYPELNKFKVTEFYTIDDIWVAQDSLKNEGKIKAVFEALVIESYIYLPKIRIRKMPVSIRHRTNVSQTIVIKLPESWTGNYNSGKLSTSAFDYSYNYNYFNNVITLNYNYVTKNDHIPTEETEKYVKTVDQIYEHVSHTLTYDRTGLSEQNKEVAASESKSSANWPMICFALFYAAVAGYVCYRLYFINIGPEPSEDLQPQLPKMLGGWLVLVAIGIIIRPLAYLVRLLISHYFDGDKLSTLAAENGYWTLGFTYEVIVNISFLLFSILLLILFFRNRNSFPRLFIIFMILSVITTFLDVFIAEVLIGGKAESSMVTMVSTVISAIVWIPYFVISERVKETFTVRCKQKSRF